MLLRAYSIGLFPMADSADDPELFWVEPEICGIIPLDRFHVSRSLAKAIRRRPFDIRFDTAFAEVMEGCAQPAPDRPTTWINDTIRSLYAALHNMGHAHSVEAWEEMRSSAASTAFHSAQPFSARACSRAAPAHPRSASSIWSSD